MIITCVGCPAATAAVDAGAYTIRRQSGGDLYFPGHVAIDQAVAVRPRPPGFPGNGAGGSGRSVCAEGFTDVTGPAWMAAREAEAYMPAERGVPLLWATNDPVADVGGVWLALHEMTPETSLVPITLAYLGERSGRRGRPWDSGELSGPYPWSDADRLDAAEVLAACWEGWLDPNGDDPGHSSKSRPFPGSSRAWHRLRRSR